VLVALFLAGVAGCAGPTGSGPAAAPPTTESAAPPPGLVAAEPAAAPAGPAKAILLAAHNRYRASHCAPPLVWSPKLAAFAQAWADRLARKGCRLEHRSRSPYGENLAAGTASIMRAQDAAAGWYGEVRKYRFGRGGFSLATGHFTQLVWIQSRRLGCGSARCGDLRVWVCNYDPPGNFEGLFAENVKPSSCRR
jgi:uncharacterized protein YkwD